MAVKAADLKPGMELPPVVKKMEQRRINLFETWGPAEWHHGANYHTDPEAARRALGGFRAPIASGRMAVEYGIQALSRWFGADVAGRSARVDFRFTVPIVDGDTVSVKGTVTHFRKGEKGTDVNLELWVENQKGQKAAVGTGSVTIPL
jgi:acyl dehydratase